MTTTTTYGYKKPQSGDRGSTVFTALEFNIDRVDQHSHDGVDSPRLGPESSAALSVALSPTWVTGSAAEGVYYQDVTVPAQLTSASLTYDDILVSIRTSTGERVYPRVTKQSPTSFRVWVNDPTLTLEAFIVT